MRILGKATAAGESPIKKGDRSLAVGRVESDVLIAPLREQAPVEMVCEVVDVNRSCDYPCQKTQRRGDVERRALKATVNQAFKISRSAAGSRTTKPMLNEKGIEMGPYKVSRLRAEMGLNCKQAGPEADKQAAIERLERPSVLDRQVHVEQPDHVGWGEITSIWAGACGLSLALGLDW